MPVLTTSPWIPAEWIKAHGLVPRGIWGADLLRFDSLALSAGVCPFAEATARLAENETGSAIVFTTACDQLRRTFDTLPVTTPPRAFLFNLPATWQTPTARLMYRAELVRLGRFLVELGGLAPTPETLRLECVRHGEARERLFEAAPTAGARDLAEALTHFQREGKVRLPPQATAKCGTIPLAIVGGPLPAAYWGVLDAIENAGGSFTLNATEAGERTLWKTPDPAGDPFEALITSYCANLVDVFQRPNTRLYSWLEERLRARRVRGIVLWHFTGCDLWRAEAQRMRDVFRLPVLVLEADEAQRRTPRDLGRIQAFIETLR